MSAEFEALLPARFKSEERARAWRVFTRVRGWADGPGPHDEHALRRLEAALKAEDPRMASEALRTYLLLAVLGVQRERAIELPTLPPLLRRLPASPDQSEATRMHADRMVALVSAHWGHEARNDWGNPEDDVASLVLAGIATQEFMVREHQMHVSRTAVLPPRALRAVLHTPLACLDPWEESAGDENVVMCSALVRLWIRALRREHPYLECLAQTLGPDPVRRLEQLLCARDELAGIAQGTLWRTLGMWQRAWRRMRLPAAFRDALGEGGAGIAPVARATWLRQTLDVPVEAAELRPRGHEAPAEGEPPVIRVGAAARTPDVDVLRTLCAKLKNASGAGRDRETAKRALVDARQTLATPVAQLALDWLCGLLGRDSSPGPVSLARYLGSLLPLVDVSAYLWWPGSVPDAWQPDPVAWMNTLEAAAIETTDQRTVPTLARLHQYAARRWPQLAGLDPTGLDAWKGAAEGRVRGHLVNTREFETAMASVALPEVRLGAALGYYAGLRISEACGLLVRDLVDQRELVIKIRDTKTDAGTRDVPLRSLLPAHWAQALECQWDRMAFYDQGSRAAYLLGRARVPYDTPTDAQMQPAVHALRRVTRDAQLTFHSLRHAFIAWSELAMCLRQWPELHLLPLVELREPRFGPEGLDAWTGAWMRPLAALADGYHGLAGLVGHEQPSTTRRYYAHWHGLIAAHVAAGLLPEPPRALLRRLTGWDTATFERKENTERSWLNKRLEGVAMQRAAVIERAGLSPVRSTSATMHATKPASRGEDLRLLSTQDVPEVVSRLHAHGHDVRRVAALMGVRPSDIEPIARWTAARRDAPAIPREARVRTVFEAICTRLDNLDSSSSVPLAQAWARLWTARDQVHVTDDPEVLLEVCSRLQQVIGPSVHGLVEVCAVRADAGSFDMHGLGAKLAALGVKYTVRERSLRDLYGDDRRPRRAGSGGSHWLLLRMGAWRAPPQEGKKPALGDFIKCHGIWQALECAVLRWAVPA